MNAVQEPIAVLQAATPTPVPDLAMRPPTSGEFWTMLLLALGAVAVFGLAWWQQRREETGN